jgi:hypothetical protein
MSDDRRRMTLVTRGPKARLRSWESSSAVTTRLVFAEGVVALRNALRAGQDIERVILDQSSTPGEYLDLLSSLPYDFVGDVLLIRPDDRGYLSAIGRGGDRVLYALDANDVQFYLITHGVLRSGAERRSA